MTSESGPMEPPYRVVREGPYSYAVIGPGIVTDRWGGKEDADNEVAKLNAAHYAALERAAKVAEAHGIRRIARDIRALIPTGDTK